MKFSIRDLFLVTVIVALAVGWGVDRANDRGLREENARLIKRLDETERSMIELITLIGKKKQAIVGPVYETQLPNSQAPAPNPPKP
jgi:hypothetical protein